MTFLASIDPRDVLLILLLVVALLALGFAWHRKER